ncbi:hypothetical protein AB0C07_40465 [Actinoplanes missouriensis]|uniref:hypothetical protein n=1 Tax=Actinoplanes missouriensis TaxID=1866 RepID=UPI0033F5A510
MLFDRTTDGLFGEVHAGFRRGNVRDEHRAGRVETELLIQRAGGRRGQLSVLALVAQGRRSLLRDVVAIFELPDVVDVQIPDDDGAAPFRASRARIAGPRGGLVSDGDGGRTNTTAVVEATVSSRR